MPPLHLLLAAAHSWDKLYSSFNQDCVSFFIQIMTYHTCERCLHWTCSQIIPAQPGFQDSWTSSPECYLMRDGSSRTWTYHSDPNISLFLLMSNVLISKNVEQKLAEFLGCGGFFWFRCGFCLLWIFQPPELLDPNPLYHQGIWVMKCWHSLANPVSFRLCQFVGQGHSPEPTQGNIICCVTSSSHSCQPRICPTNRPAVSYTNHLSSACKMEFCSSQKPLHSPIQFTTLGMHFSYNLSLFTLTHNIYCNDDGANPKCLFLHTKHWSKHFTCINPVNPYNKFWNSYSSYPHSTDEETET